MMDKLECGQNCNTRQDRVGQVDSVMVLMHLIDIITKKELNSAIA